MPPQRPERPLSPPEPPLSPQLMAFVAEERKRYTVYPPPEQVFTWTQMCDIWDVSRAVLCGSLSCSGECKTLKVRGGCTDSFLQCFVP